MSITESISVLKSYKQQNAGKYGILAIGIFGSVARNEDAPGSDVDIVIKLVQPDLFTMAGIKMDLEELYHKHVDVINYSDTMNAFLKHQIDKEVVYA